MTELVIYGDAAAATIVEKSKSKNSPFIFKTDGSGGKHLMVSTNFLKLICI